METVKIPAEGRVLLHNASWETYERLIAEREERTAPRFFYDRGDLEIASPSFEHEAISRLVAILVGELAVEAGSDVSDAGSTTFKREDIGRGFEPDGCFYFSENAERVRGKRNIDLDAEDLPPISLSKWTSPAHLRTSSRSTLTSVPWRYGDSLTVGR